ncbi:anti-sigma factor [Streptomyces sp. Tu 2975]|uniref:anti-sigma factor n=1 Tax=Streptomyces sp. Tu 2975 TaxID=2676871 RepID=UPI00135C8195|nr:anti-sigma factor [Streptomyces sp. Tu 2975]QIP87338.1 anti-sigma factor [Streptomyces sp. Tu 2975]
MNTGDLHLLTGAYVLHALPPGELADFERHLPGCPSCSEEVRELAATTGKLASAVAVAPPPVLKQRVMARIAAERQAPPVVPRQSRRGSTRRRRALSRFALAASLAAAATLGSAALWQYQEAQSARDAAQRTERRAADLASVLAAPDAKVVSAGLSEGATGTVVVSRARNKAAFLAAGLPKPTEGKVYQLWFADGGSMRSAGLMDGSGATAAVVMEGPLDGASGIGITVEPAGGSPQPTSDPLALMTLPA